MDKTLIVHKWTKPCEVLNSISPLASFCKESCLGNVGSYIKFYFSRSGIKDQYKQLWCFAVICLNTYYRYRTRKEFVIYTSLLERSLECPLTQCNLPWVEIALQKGEWPLQGSYSHSFAEAWGVSNVWLWPLPRHTDQHSLSGAERRNHLYQVKG